MVHKNISSRPKDFYFPWAYVNLPLGNSFSPKFLLYAILIFIKLFKNKNIHLYLYFLLGDQIKLTPDENLTMGENPKEELSAVHDILPSESPSVAVSISNSDIYEDIADCEKSTMQPELFEVEKRALHAEAGSNRIVISKNIDLKKYCSLY